MARAACVCECFLLCLSSSACNPPQLWDLRSNAPVMVWEEDICGDYISAMTSRSDKPHELLVVSGGGPFFKLITV